MNKQADVEETLSEDEGKLIDIRGYVIDLQKSDELTKDVVKLRPKVINYGQTQKVEKKFWVIDSIIQQLNFTTDTYSKF